MDCEALRSVIVLVRKVRQLAFWFGREVARLPNTLKFSDLFVGFRKCFQTANFSRMALGRQHPDRPFAVWRWLLQRRPNQFVFAQPLSIGNPLRNGQQDETYNTEPKSRNQAQPFSAFDESPSRAHHVMISSFVVIGNWSPRSCEALKSQIGLIGGILNAYGRFCANDYCWPNGSNCTSHFLANTSGSLRRSPVLAPQHPAIAAPTAIFSAEVVR